MTHSKLLFGISIAVFTLVLTACVGSGIQVSEPRPVGDFDGIEVSGSMYLMVKVGQEPSVRVVADDNLVHRVESEVHGGRLHLRSPRPAIQDTPLEVVVTTPGLSHLGVSLAGDVGVDLDGEVLDELAVTVRGAGKLRVAGVSADRLRVDVNGAGNVQIDGGVNHLDFELTGVGAGKFAGLCARTAQVRLGGAGKVTLNAIETLDARFSGAGSVNYYGNPEVEYDDGGAGGLHRLGNTTCEVGDGA